ncbi:MAG: S24 family peptidase [Alphaproteobacteria bacterium]|nr:S24 family peptidase [Alphaproteobacteria bacterium]MBQ3946320.1 S24 family peptidase [Alphaproteobacteria bacterium]
MLLDEKIQSLQKETKRKITYEEVAGVLGLGSKQAAYNRITRKQDLKDWEILKLEEAFLWGEKDNKGYVSLDYYPDVMASCGDGNYITNETKEKLTIPLQAINNYSPHNKYTVIKATSDSMLPEIKPNDFLVVQHEINNIIDNHIYIFSYAGDLFCKYLSNNLGQIVVRSANTVYPIRYIEGESLKDFRLIGEVKAHIREYDI